MTKRLFTLIGFLLLALPIYAQSTFPSDINLIIGYGQSLSLGSTDGLSINTKGLGYPNLWMFNTGLRLQKGEADSSLTHFVPLVEHKNEETPISGMADMMMKSFSDIRYTKKDYVFRTPGWGGKSVKLLRPNPVEPQYYTGFMRGVRQAKYIADQQKKSFNVPLFTWTQGEADIYDGMDSITYKQQLKSLYNEINEDVKHITKQTNDVKCILYQTASHNRYYHITNREDRKLNPAIAIAQYQMAKENKGFYLATPMYPFEYNLDNVHLCAEYSRLLGAYYGYIAKKVLEDQQEWKPIYPTKISIKGNKIVLKMHVPVKPLVIDTNWVQYIDNYGFNVYRTDSAIDIASVSLTGPDEVTILCTEKLQDGDRITYAINGENTGRFIGSRGNIRDSQGDKITYQIGSTVYHLHNWLPIFEEKIKL